MIAPTRAPAPPRPVWPLLTILVLAPVLGVIGALTVGKRLGSPPAAQGGSHRLVRLQAAAFPTTIDSSPITALTLAPDGLAVVGSETGLVELRGGDGAPIAGQAVRFAEAPVIAVAVSNDGSTFAAATDKSAYVATRASPRTGIVIPVFGESDTSMISSIALDARGRSLAVAEFSVRIFDAPTGRQTVALEQPMSSSGGRGVYEAVAFSTDDTTVIASDTYQTDSWSRPAWSLKSTYPCQCNHVARPSPSARWASYGTSDGHLLLRDLAAERTTRDLTVTATPKSYTGDTAVNDDGSLLIAGSSVGEVIAWRASANQPAGRLKVGNAEIGLLRLSANGRLIIVGETTDTFLQPAHRYEYKLWLVRISDG